MQMQVNIGLEDLYSGKSFDAEIKRHEVCSVCGGAGAEPGVEQVRVSHCLDRPTMLTPP